MTAGCPSSLCDSPFSVENCGPHCEPITSPECLACEAELVCGIQLDCTTVVGDAEAGPAEGRPRAVLCREVLACLRDTGCWSDDNLMSCYCGSASESECEAGNGDGACKLAMERGYEADSYASVYERLFTVSLGGGHALTRYLCGQECPGAVCSSGSTP